ncbi:acyltransferase family protein [Brachybacterium paraconglomeratum]|uniref:acyltransferase family protein n=1 Tax=Brachybacterium paraconglomeratum TaxID=173362 RepID=UPI001300C83F|nr:acyltransferase [Brachybacterium paraconglomeratum]
MTSSTSSTASPATGTRVLSSPATATGPARATSAAAPTGEPTREHWMDLLRGTAILLVIAHHLRLVQQIWDGGTPWAMVELSEALAPFRMPALLFASGLLLARSLRRPPGRFLAGKLRGLLWPWLLWSAVMLPILGWGHADEPLWWLNGMYTWFLAALFCYYVIGLVTRRIHPGWIALASVVVWTALPLLGAAHDWLGPRPDKFIFYAVFFFAGAALRPLLARGPLPWPVVVPALAVAAGWAAYASKIDAEPRVPVLAQLVILLAVIGAVGVLQRLPRLLALRPVEWLGRNSVVPYLVHLPVIELLGRHSDLPAGPGTFALYYAVTIGVCVLAVLLRPVTGFLYAFPARKAAAAAGEAVSQAVEPFVDRAVDAMPAAGAAPVGEAAPARTRR